MNRNFIYFLAIAALFLGIGAYFSLAKNKNIAPELTVDSKITAYQLSNDFAKDTTSAKEKYLNKRFIVEGIVRELNKNGGALQIALETGVDTTSVACNLNIDSKNEAIPQTGEEVKIQGVCANFNVANVFFANCNILK